MMSVDWRFAILIVEDAIGRGFVFVYLACFAGYISSAEPEIFEDMNTSQNKPLAA